MIPSVYLGNDTALVRTVFGRKLYVDTRDIVVAPHLLVDGDWEPWIRVFLERTLQPGMSFVDVGAHVGWYTLLAWNLVGESGWVEAFEPVPRHVKLLRQSLMINGFLERVAQAAASNAQGQLSFAWSARKGGNGHVTGAFGEEPISRVNGVRLDEHFEKADFVKIDAEGHEPEVLEGMRGLFDRCPKIQVLVEHHGPGTYSGCFEGERQVLGELVRSGFKIGVVEHDGFLSEVKLDDLGDVPDSEMLFLARP